MTDADTDSDRPLTTREMLYATVCQHAEDDTPRLAYADYLDGLDPVRVPCPHCGGGRSGAWSHATDSRGRCATCKGTGTVLDTSDADLAEFIRVQCELARYEPKVTDDDRAKRWWTLKRREKQLQLKHEAEWRKCPCPGCKGHGRGWAMEKDCSDAGWWGPQCSTCGGTGDLFGWQRGTGEGGRFPRENGDRLDTFGRGFIDSVECAAADVWREEPCGACGGEWSDRIECRVCSGRGTRFVPTEWAKAVVRSTPVTRFVVTDREPNEYVSPVEPRDWTWVLDPDEDDMVLGDETPHFLPRWLWDLLDGYITTPSARVRAKRYPAPRAARDALALALGRRVRKAAYGSPA